MMIARSATNYIYEDILEKPVALLEGNMEPHIP
jgi:hypothetical protein